MQKLHFIGIGGTGMNGVAQLAAHTGYSISGSDRSTGLEIFQTLEKQGIRILLQNGSGISEETDAVVYSTAIESNNPEIQKSKSLNIPLLHRAEMLAKLCEGKEVIAVAGSAGKSTVTGLLGWIFERLGKDPTVYCGAQINNFGSSIRFGSDPWIIEADESDRSFLHFHPQHAIITNISEDHFELPELRELFAQFKAQVSDIVIDEANGVSTNNLMNRDYQIIGLTPERIPLLGRHNVENVNNALSLCKALDLDLQKCMEAVHTFKGVERRLERIGKRVFDDYAHSPVKIEAAFTAVTERYDRVLAYWRPHGFGPLAQHADALRKLLPRLLRPADLFFVLPVYYAGGTVKKKLTAEQFCEGLDAVEFIPDYDALEDKLRAEAGSEDAILGMGARDPELPKFARRLTEVLMVGTDRRAVR